MIFREEVAQLFALKTGVCDTINVIELDTRHTD